MSETTAHSENVSKKRKKSSFYKQNKNCKSNNNNIILSESMNGFLVTCNLKEYQCLRESYNLLNEFADKLYGNVLNTNTNESSETDIETAIQNEIKSLNHNKRRFQQVITKCNNVLFIKCNDEAIDPLIMSSSILKEIETNGKQLTRHLLRLIPIVVTCKANGNNLDELIESYLEKQTNESISYVIQCKVRNNSDVKRLQLIESVVPIVKKVRPQWTVNFDKPKMTIVLEILHKMCCISFLNDYEYYKKYNLIEFAKKITERLNSNKSDTKV